MITEMTPFNLMHKGILALGRAEAVGICIDVPYCKRINKHLERQIAYYQREFDESDLARLWKKTYRSNTNFGSNPQLADILYNKMGFEPKKLTDKGNPSTDEAALTALNIPEVEGIIKIGHLQKVKDTYIGAFLREQVDGIMHPSFGLNGVLSYRSSSSNPNFQNIPNRDPELKKLCRQAIVARPGNKLLCVDYGQQEVRIGAAYHKDPSMIKYIKDPSTDMHRDAAFDVFKINGKQITKPLRNTVKGLFVFAEFYGDWYKSCATGMWEQIQSEEHILQDGTHILKHLATKGIKNYTAFENHIQKVEDILWNQTFPVYKQWKLDWYAMYCKQGFVDALNGFRYQGVMTSKEVCNYPIQGPAFHCLLLAFILLDLIQDERKWKTRLVAQIHDEVMLDVYPPEEEEVIETVRWVMEKEVPRIYKWINVPLLAEPEMSPIGGSWYDKHAKHIGGN